MPSLDDIRRRIKSVSNSRQITRAMKLVAGAKLKRATEAAVAARPYQQALQDTIDNVVQAAGDVEHPMLAQPNNQTDVVVAVLSSDRGLCGGFNNNLLRKTQAQIDDLVAAGKKVSVICYGKKAVKHFTKRGYNVIESNEGVNPGNHQALTDALATRLLEELQQDGFSEAKLAYNAFKNVMTQVPQFDTLLPMKVSGGEGEGAGGDYIYEPEGQEILNELLPMSLRTRIFQAFLETEAGEQGARMAAMDAATRNASDLVDALTLDYNRARQAAITKELIEIVSGAEAL